MSRVSKIFSGNFPLAVSLVALGVGGRLLPHLWNATPIIAISIIAGKYLGRRYAIILPVVSMLISDLLLGWYAWPIMISVYGSFVLAGILGYFGREEKGVSPLVILAVSGSLIFFLITNAAVWLFGTMYPHTIAGLIMSYLAGLPFLRNMIIGDMVYTAVLGMIFEKVFSKKLAMLKYKLI